MPKADHPSRRDILAAGLAAHLGGDPIGRAIHRRRRERENAASAVKVRYDELLPHEFRKRLAERPIAYLPLGTLEWHGEHLPLGSDAIQSEGLMVECARRFGGIVMPPIHLGPDRAKPADDGKMLVGMDYADIDHPAATTRWKLLLGPGRASTCSWWTRSSPSSSGRAFVPCSPMVTGRRASSWVENLPERQARFGLKLFGVTRDIARQWKSQVDHAARNETSLMMHFRPDLVDLSQLPSSRSTWPQGVGGEDPRDATAAYGKECFEKSVELVRQMFAAAGLL